jgi:hypothetical protein
MTMGKDTYAIREREIARLARPYARKRVRVRMADPLEIPLQASGIFTIDLSPHSAMTRPLLFQRGGALLRVVVTIPVAVLVIAIGWFVYTEYQRNYWDDKVRTLCATEGGIKIFERVPLRDHRYVDSRMNIRIPAKLEHPTGYGPLSFEAKPEDLFYRQTITTIIRAQRPRVARDDVLVIRASDKKVLGQATSFGRVGGDFVAIDFESRFRCPIEASESNLVEKVFKIELAAGEGQ